MGYFCRRPAAHKTVIHQVAPVGPRRYLILDELLRKDRRVIERHLVSRARRADIVSKNIARLSLGFYFATYVLIGNIAASGLRDPKRLDLGPGGFRRLGDRV